MLFTISVVLLFLKCILADYANGIDSRGWQPYASNGVSNLADNHLNYGNPLQDLSSLGVGWNSHINIEPAGWNQHHHHTDHHAHAIPIAQHIEVSKPIAIPVIKNIGVPLPQPIGIPVTQVTAVGVPQPYPVHVPVAQPVAIPVIKTVATIVEKRVPIPIEKIVPVPVEKPVPIPIEKHIPVHVEKPYPVHVPIYKHVFHRHRSHGWDR